MKLCLIYNFAQHYRQEIFQLLDSELGCDFYFGDKMGDVKKLNYSVLKNFKGELKNKWIGHICYYQKGIITILRKHYDHYIFLGEVRCLTTWLALVYCKFTKSKIHLWSHGWYGKENFAERFLKHIFFRLADTVLLYGNYARDIMIKKGFNPNKLFVIYNSLAYDKQLSIRSKLSQDNRYITHFGNNNRNLIFIGRLTKVKRLDLLLQAVAGLKKRDEFYNLILIGDGEERENLQKICNDLNLNDCIWFYGACYDETELSSLIYNADLCVSPGNVGLTAIHTMVFGCPVISHNDFKWQMPEFEAIERGKTGGFFKKENLQSLEDAISNFFKSCPAKDVVRCNCYRVIDEKYNPHIQLKTIKHALDIH